MTPLSADSIAAQTGEERELIKLLPTTGPPGEAWGGHDESTSRHKPANATHWSTRTMAAAAGISEASVAAHLARPAVTAG